MWKSDIFENTIQGGLFVALALEQLSSWHGAGPEYRDLCLLEDPFLFRPVGSGMGVFMSGPDGDIIHEASWIRTGAEPGILLAGWNEWDDGRDQWLVQLLQNNRGTWIRHSQTMELKTGTLVLLHAEGAGLKATPAPDGRAAVCGEYLSVSLTPGRYFLETSEFEQRPEGSNCCEVCRWVPVGPGEV